MNKELIENLVNDGMYTFIANNYYKIDKADLKGILLEYIYTLETTLFDVIKYDDKVVVLDKNDIENIKNDLIDNIADRLN